MKKWEYKWLFIPDYQEDGEDALLSAWGNEGWRMTTHLKNEGGFSYLFEREVIEPPPPPKETTAELLIAAAHLEVGERMKYAEPAGDFPKNQMVFSLTSVETMLLNRARGWVSGQ